jgi:phage repressor protein C with HTH and peptisase S24 domain
MIGAYEEKRAEPKLLTLVNICHYFETHIDDIVLKNLSASEGREIKKYIQGEQLRILPILIDKQQDVEMISVVPVKASAGYLAGYGDVDFIERLDKFRLPVPEISNNKTYRVFQISGDSMLPIKPGSYIICEYVHDWFDIRNEQCYILITKDDGIVYKRIINNLNDGHLLLKSDNPEYQPYKIEPSSLVEAWKAIGYFSFNLPAANDNKTGSPVIEEMLYNINNNINDIKQQLKNAD